MADNRDEAASEPLVEKMELEPVAAEETVRPSVEAYLTEKVALTNDRGRKFLAEFLGSFIMALSGIGAAHCAALHSGGSSVHGALAGGLGLALGIYAAAGVSGGHINPAVTAAFMFLGRMGNGMVQNVVNGLIYIVAQCSGMFVAAAVVHGIFAAGEASLPGAQEGATPEQLEGMVCMYATCPGSTYTNTGASMFFDQVFTTMVLAVTVLATIDPCNANPGGMAPLLIGLSATTMGLCFGDNAGGAINTARDFGPRVFASILYGEVAFTGIADTNSDHFFWIPLLGPIVGGMLAALIYLIFVAAHWPKKQ